LLRQEFVTRPAVIFSGLVRSTTPGGDHVLHLLNRIVVAAGIGLATTAAAGAAEPGMSASAEGPAATAACTLVRTPADLNRVRYSLSGSFCLANDLDFELAEFVPIGSARTPFLGSFDGQGHTIRNYLMRSALANVGLFGVVGSSDTTSGARGVIRNLSLEAATVQANVDGVNTGVLVGRIAPSGRVSNARTWTRYLFGRGNTGGLAGVNEGDVNSSYSSGDFSNDRDSNAGGLVGVNHGRVSQSFADATLAAADFMGGLVGSNFGTITRSGAHGVIGRNDWSWGGGGGRALGGLVGLNATGARIGQSFATGEVFVVSGAGGGLVGHNAEGASISQSFATGPVVRDMYNDFEAACAGLVAWTDSSRISQSYAAGESHYCGAGLVAFGGERIGSSYWDRDTTGESASNGGSPLTTTQLQARLPGGFSPDAWAITNNVTYPYLKDLFFKSPLARPYSAAGS
jgi:hypothetical protein